MGIQSASAHSSVPARPLGMEASVSRGASSRAVAASVLVLVLWRPLPACAGAGAAWVLRRGVSRRPRDRGRGRRRFACRPGRRGRARGLDARLGRRLRARLGRRRPGRRAGRRRGGGRGRGRRRRIREPRVRLGLRGRARDAGESEHRRPDVVIFSRFEGLEVEVVVAGLDGRAATRRSQAASLDVLGKGKGGPGQRLLEVFGQAAPVVKPRERRYDQGAARGLDLRGNQMSQRVSSHGPIMGGGLDSSPLDGASTAASSPRNDFVKNYWVHATH